ncbi:MAG: aspartate--tRNA ligase [Acutalibacteraceae bacterium]
MIENMEGLQRTNYCGDFTINDVDKEVMVCGWVQRQRDLGHIIFVDLRDRTGIVQLAFSDETDKEIFKKAFSVRAEFVLAAKGVIRERSSKNLQIKTGEIEIDVTDLRVLSVAETPPFEILEDSNANEELRLKYRYLDLRRPDVQDKIIARHKIVKIARDYFDKNGFIEIETPMLIKSTPEGARDYLVPSRVFPGNFFALPQSPQLYKQLLMLSGFDRYFQVARCFRDEDLRADRQPEFTQIDLEMSFVNSDDVMAVTEGFIKKVFKEVLDKDVVLPLKRLTYNEAMTRFGSDKPDLRFGMELVNLTELLKNSEFKVFSSAIAAGGSVCAINAREIASKLPRKEIDKLIEWIKAYGAKGLAWTKINLDGTSSSSYEKFLSESEILAIRNAVNAQNDDVIFIVASDEKQTALESLGALRCEIARKFNIINDSEPNLLWITDFPLFEFDKEENRYVAKHHPFTAPRDEDISKLDSEPQNVYAKAYDLVLNGNEVGGGSIRINNPELQQKMFKALGFQQEDAYERFGFLIDAFKYGAPPHGGLAFGLDRLVMLMLNCKSIRDVIAFPKVASSAELMSNSPNTVDVKQLEELSINLNLKK